MEIPSNTCVMFLVRLGATASNVARPPILQGRGVNHGLSEVGRTQAERTAEFLAGQKIDAVFSSPLLRAQETAAAIAARHGLAVNLVEALVEADVGRWEGKSWADVARLEPELHRQFMADCGTTGYGGGENFLEVLERVTPAINAIAAAHTGKRVVVVGHNVVNRAYLSGVLHVPIAKSRAIVQDNCGVNVLHIGNGEARVVTLNATFHLDSAART